jgi:hypothetical protein
MKRRFGWGFAVAPVVGGLSACAVRQPLTVTAKSRATVRLSSVSADRATAYQRWP